MTLIAFVVDLFAMSLVLGASTWFFFIQSPVLYTVMDRERFVPVQMRLALVLLNTVTVSLVVMLVGAILWANAIVSGPVLTAAFGLAAACINRFLVLPMALKAGRQSRRNLEGQGEPGTAVGFAVEGAGPSAAVMHRMVVLFVVLMVAALVAHGITIAAEHTFN